jgi:hypothetical protein
VDIGALEQRDEVPIPVMSEPAAPRPPKGQDVGGEQHPAWREPTQEPLPVQWPQPAPRWNPDPDRVEPGVVTVPAGPFAVARRRSMSFLRAGRQSED